MTEENPSVAESAKKAVVDHEQALDELSATDHKQIDPEIVDLEAHTATGQMIYLPKLIADEFGIQEHSARDMVLLGQVTIGGEIVDTKRGWFRYSQVKNQDISVDSDVKSVRFHYAG